MLDAKRMLNPLPLRFTLWLFSCALFAGVGFVIGRQSTPAPVHDRAGPKNSASPNSIQEISVQHKSPGHRASTCPSQTSAERLQALALLIRRLGTNPASQELGTMLDLAAWLSAADENEFAAAKTLAATEARGELAAISFGLLLYDRWAALNGPAALADCLAQTKNHPALRTIFQSWIRNGDAADAIKHALVVWPDQSASIGELLILWHQQDPASAAAFARRLAAANDDRERESAHLFAAKLARNVLSAEGADAALRTIADWPDANARDELRASLFSESWDVGTDHTLEAALVILRQIESPERWIKSETFAALSASFGSLIQQGRYAEIDRWCAALPDSIRPLATNQIAVELADRGRLQEALALLTSHPAAPDASPAPYREAYHHAAVAAAKAGDITEALRLATRAGTAPWPDTWNALLLRAWSETDSSRADLLIDAVLAKEAGTPPPSGAR